MTSWNIEWDLESDPDPEQSYFFERDYSVNFELLFSADSCLLTEDGNPDKYVLQKTWIN